MVLGIFERLPVSRHSTIPVSKGNLRIQSGRKKNEVSSGGYEKEENALSVAIDFPGIFHLTYIPTFIAV
jgi:hypothetical protein